MRILHVVPSFGLGGMEKIICAVIDECSEEHQHDILALNGNVDAVAWISKFTGQIVPFFKSDSRSVFFNSLFHVLRKHRPDLLMTYNWGATDAIWLGRLLGIANIVHHEHGFNADEGVTTSWRRDVVRYIVYRLATKVVVVSHELEGMLNKRFGLGKPRVVRIPNGIDTALYAPDDAERLKMRASLGYEDSHFVIGFSGRLDPVKNLDLLLDIFECSKPHENPFRLLIVGDGSERVRLEARCQSEDLKNYVKFVGQQSQVLPFLRAMDVFLLTSLREQMPLTVLEAMAVEVPVVSTRVGELPFVIDDGVHGYMRDLSAPVEQFVQPLRNLLSATTKQAMGAAARARVVQQFQLDKMLEEYLELIRGFDRNPWARRVSQAGETACRGEYNSFSNNSR